MSDEQQGDPQRPPTEEELRAAYEAEIKQISIQQIVLENVVTLVNMGMRRTGLIQGTEDERDATQVQTAIEGVRAHLPLVEAIAPAQASQIRDALSQLQLAYVQIGGNGELKLPKPEGGTAADAPQPSQKPAAASKLWVPGQ